MSYFANECFVCKSTETLEICGNCNMISYCGSKHQKYDWPKHKEFCNVISCLLKETGLSHIYEKQLNSDLQTWIKERERMSQLIETTLGRSLHLHEEQMILMPRSCFVCHETRQELLKNCPKCLCVNFCQQHQELNLQHNKDCLSLKLFHDLDEKIQNPNKLRIIMGILKKIVTITFDIIPETMENYLNQFLTNDNDDDDVILIKSCISNILTMPLTLFNAVKKLKLDNRSELIIHVRCELPDSIVWELLLHFLPKLSFLKIIFLNQSECLKTKMKLCNDCCEKEKKLILQMKNLNYENFVEDELYIKPDLLAYMPAEEEEENNSKWENLLEIFSRIGCPLLLTCVTEMKLNRVVENLKMTFWTNLILNEDLNEFGALEPLREWTNNGVGKLNQFMIIADSFKNYCRAKHFANDSPLLLKKEKGEYWNSQYFFFSHICRGCREKSSIITCKYCNMIFYCSELHRREDWYQHKDLCKLIQKLLIESGRKNIFAGEIDLMDCNKVTNEIWLEVKLNVIKKIEFEIERELLIYEQQMFLFPKACFACHECDLMKLYICRCGIALCKIHKDYRGHKLICNDYYLSYLLHENEEIVEFSSKFEFLAAEFDDNLPNSMQEFLELWLILLETDIIITSIEKIIIAELLTRPLTLLCAMKKLPINFNENKILTIHVIGSNNSKYANDEYWNVFFYWLKMLNKINIIFIGINTKEVNYTRNSFGNLKNLTCKSYSLTYEQFVLGKFFIKPDIIVGYDLDIHECDVKACNCIKDILVINKMNVPFILTAGTKERAINDNRKISQLFQPSITPDLVYLNPFASLEPIRDFETEYLRYLNKYVIIYWKWIIARDEKIDIFQKQISNSSRSFELEKKLSELFTKTKINVDDVETNDNKSRDIRDDYKFEDEIRPQISSVFAASSELKYLLKDYESKSNVNLEKPRRTLDEPDLRFVKCTKKIDLQLNLSEEKNEINHNNEDVEVKCREVFESLLNSSNTENINEIEENEIADVEIDENEKNSI
ncbi:uncharacterized protein LOC127285739 [Leptopilina boulardi]|uniref:uncharacterized protein LOC127285739 n=1 Tax=Leptopilina boulardi TaxID=63433 RepID=UPI0021F6567F|nr:uncharacterized protein LOC127285739 [Leptopilina boulardi]